MSIYPASAAGIWELEAPAASRSSRCAPSATSRTGVQAPLADVWRRRERFVSWQLLLAAAFQHGLLDPAPFTARLISAMTGGETTLSEIDWQGFVSMCRRSDGRSEWLARGRPAWGTTDRVPPSPPRALASRRAAPGGDHPKVLRPWQNQLGKQLGYESVRACRSIVFRVLRFAEDEGAIPANPMRNGMLVWSTEQRTSRGINAEEIERLARQVLEVAGER